MPHETPALPSCSCSVIVGCLPTWEGGPMATEAVAPILYTLSLTNRLGGCLVTLCSWGAHRSSAHTPVSRSSSLPILQSGGFALLHNLCWRAGVLRPLWWTQGYWTKQRTQWNTHSVAVTLLVITGRPRQRRQRDNRHDLYVSENIIQPHTRRT